MEKTDKKSECQFLPTIKDEDRTSCNAKEFASGDIVRITCDADSSCVYLTIHVSNSSCLELQLNPTQSSRLIGELQDAEYERKRIERNWLRETADCNLESSS